jgi:hypothetical protein
MSTKWIASKRRTGKTTRLIGLAEDRRGYIVCHSREEAQRIADEARRMDVKINFPLTYDEFVRGQYYGKGVETVYIDNADMLLHYLCHHGVRLGAVTINEEVFSSSDE